MKKSVQRNHRAIHTAWILLLLIPFPGFTQEYRGLNQKSAIGGDTLFNRFYFTKQNKPIVPATSSSGFLMDSTFKYCYYSAQDSIAEFKIYYIYDEANNLIKDNTFFWRDNLWKKTYYTDYGYDERNNLTLSENYWWEDTLNNWIPISKRESVYNNNNKLVQETFSSRDNGTSQLVPQYKFELIFDESGKETSFISYTWDNGNSEWINSYKSESFDTSNNKIYSVSYTWNTTNNAWQELRKGEEIFDESGNRISLVSFKWNTDDSIWVNAFKELYYYDLQGNDSTTEGYTWNETMHEWIGEYKSINLYDLNGNKISGTGYDWDNVLSQWVVKSKFEYTYDSGNNQTKATQFSWDDSSGQWTEEESFEYIFDTNNNQILAVWNNTNGEPGQFVMNKDFYYYSLHSLINSSSGDNVSKPSVFPNPADEFIEIRLDGDDKGIVNIFDLSGKLIKVARVSQLNNRVPVNEFQTGVYVIQIIAKNQLSVTKIRIK